MNVISVGLPLSQAMLNATAGATQTEAETGLPPAGEPEPGEDPEAFRERMKREAGMDEEES